MSTRRVLSIAVLLLTQGLILNSASAQVQFETEEDLDDPPYIYFRVDCSQAGPSTVQVTVNSDMTIDVWANGQTHQFAFNLNDGNNHEIIVIGSPYHDDIDVYGTSFGPYTLVASLSGYAGSDNIRVHSNLPAMIHGGDGNDFLYGGFGDDSIVGSDGNDIIEGRGGDDWLRGDDGDDNIWGHNGNDKIAGGLGSDLLNGGNGDDEIWGNTYYPTILWYGSYLVAPDFDFDQMTGGDGSDEFHYAFYYWNVLSNPSFPFPLAIKVYHEKDGITDFSSTEDTRQAHFFPTFRLPSLTWTGR